MLLEKAFAKFVGDVFDHRFNGDHPLRATKTAKGGVGNRIGFARPTPEQCVGDVVRVISVTQRTGHNPAGQIGNIAAPSRHIDDRTFYPPIVVEPNAILEQKIVALAGGDHVVVPAQA